MFPSAGRESPQLLEALDPDSGTEAPLLSLWSRFPTRGLLPSVAPGNRTRPSLVQEQEAAVTERGEKLPLEKGLAPHPGLLARGNALDRGAWRATAHGVAKS